MLRTIKFDSPFIEFYWSEPKKQAKEKKRFQVKDIIDVIEGKKSMNFEKYPCAKKELCFSILTVTRTIDLECENEEDYMNLLGFFKFIMFVYNKFENDLLVLECMDDVLYDHKIFLIEV